MTQPLGSDIASELHSIKADAITCSVGRLSGFVQRFGPSCYPQYASARGDHFAILERRACVEDLKSGMTRQVFESMDGMALGAGSRIACAGDHHAKTAER